jgi:hypothetical protein
MSYKLSGEQSHHLVLETNNELQINVKTNKTFYMRYGDSVLVLNVVNNVVLFENNAGTKLETRGQTDAPPKQETFTIENDIYPIGTPIHFQDKSIQHASTLFNIIDVNDLPTLLRLPLCTCNNRSYSIGC